MKFFENRDPLLVLSPVALLISILLLVFASSCNHAEGADKVTGKWQMVKGEYNGKHWEEEMYFVYNEDGTYRAEVPAFPEDNTEGHFHLVTEGEEEIPVVLHQIEEGREDTVKINIITYSPDSMVYEYDFEDYHSMRIYLTKVK